MLGCVSCCVGQYDAVYGILELDDNKGGKEIYYKIIETAVDVVVKKR